LGEEDKEDKMGGACVTYGREEISIQGNVKETDHLEDLGVDGRIIIKLVLKKWDERAWTQLICFKANRDKLRALLKMVIIFYYFLLFIYLLQLGFHPVAVVLTLVHTIQMDI
jgi:hypothetical protein